MRLCPCLLTTDGTKLIRAHVADELKCFLFCLGVNTSLVYTEVLLLRTLDLSAWSAHLQL